MVNPEDYSKLKSYFLKHINTIEGPWQLTVPLLQTLEIRNRGSSPVIDDHTIIQSWAKLVDELCPIEASLVENFNKINEKILEINSSTNIIYAICRKPFNHYKRVLRISDEPTIVLLKFNHPFEVKLS